LNWKIGRLLARSVASTCIPGVFIMALWDDALSHL